ncbi:MAG: LamG-like jellyroll fold domain-containing protein [Solirubrobacteraceae bacterium]
MPRPGGRAVRRAILFAVPVLVVVAATPTLAAFSAAITGSGTDTAASLVLTTTPSGGSTCTSTGATSTPFTSDSTSCTGSVWPSTELSSSSSSSLATTFATAGTTAPSSATLASGSAGLAVESDISGDGDDGFALGGVTFGAGGPLGAASTSFNGSTGMLETEEKLNSPASGNFTLSAWFKVASGYSSGGEIIGFANTQTGTPASWAPNLWMDNSGHIAAGETTGSTKEVATTSAVYNTGNWYYVVASFSSSTGLTIYVNGSSVATNSSATSATAYTGYWTLGWAYGSGYTPTPTSYYLAGSLAEVAVFPAALSSAQVTTLYGGGSGTESSFETRVKADAPSEFWPLQSASTTTNLPYVGSLPDVSGNNDLGTPEGGVTPSDDGPFVSDGAMYFDGASTSKVETATSNAALPASWSVAAWFRAPSGLSTGGTILSFDTAQAGGGSGHDPLVWMDNSGKIVVGTYAGGQKEATSSVAYNTGTWYFLVATVSSTGGLSLYIDGSLVGSNAAGTAGGTSGGYWIIGYGDDSGWTDVPSNLYWTGQLAHVAYFPSTLSSGAVTTLYGDSTLGTFEAQVLADSPTYYWPLTDSGTSESEAFPFFQVEPDASGANDDATAVGSTVTLGIPGPFSSASYAAALSGSTGYLETASSIASGSDPDTFSLVAWFKAPSHATGGGIIGYDASQNGTGLSHDREIWMDNSGKIAAGISGGSGVEATSTSTYDNNAWHLVVAVFTPTTLTLYVDGTQVGSASSGISDVNYAGYWTVGFMNNTGTWADMPTNEEWTGALADLAVIPSALSSGTDTTIHGEASQSALQSELLSLSPSAYWPLSSLAGAPTDTGGVEVSVQAANNGTTSCLFPAGAGSCPALTESDLFPNASSSTLAAPTASHSTTVTLAAEDSSTPPAGFAGLHFIVPLTFSGTVSGSSWSASLAYLAANVEF